MSRLLIVANRLPVTVSVTDGALHIERSAGGLATGLKGPHERSGGLWIGWPGQPSEALQGHEEELAGRMMDFRLAAVPLSRGELEQYYDSFCNGILWPLFHDFMGQLPLEITGFDAYEQVNQRFAEAVVAHHQPGDVIWVHDYQLMLVPKLIRDRIPDARIGFFLHTPFPASDTYRTLPYREQILEGLLGADLVGFHTAAYVRHFAHAVLHLLGVSTDLDRLRWQNRHVRVGVFPMGIDGPWYRATADEHDVVERSRELRSKDEQLLVGIDRLDYTKGIPRRLLSFERFLADHPELHQKVRLIQVSVPSRTNVEAYQGFREQVDGLIGRIHGRFATPSWAPIHYLFRSLSEREVIALYRAADVMVVTPIRDGMNLVAKEFVASRNDEDGVLVLSELAGAAAELAEAVLVNPYDIHKTADAIYRALTMPKDERRTRMRALRRRVFGYDVHRWVSSFLTQLEQTSEPGRVGREAGAIMLSSTDELRSTLERMKAAKELILVLDYDGTLVPFAGTPELARPDAALLQLLRKLAARPRTHVHVVSGRSRETLEHWLGALPVGLHAEHGLWSRPVAGDWKAMDTPSASSWRDAVLKILEEFAARTPGSLVEEKTIGLAWHYRMADPDYGEHQANDLKLHLRSLLSNVPVEILPGDKVIEVRPHGVNKGVVVSALASTHPEALLVAMGDDRTDEDMFSALPKDAVSLHVGMRPTVATQRLADVRAARSFWAELIRG